MSFSLTLRERLLVAAVAATLAVGAAVKSRRDARAAQALAGAAPPPSAQPAARGK